MIVPFIDLVPIWQQANTRTTDDWDLWYNTRCHVAIRNKYESSFAFYVYCLLLSFVLFRWDKVAYVSGPLVKHICIGSSRPQVSGN